MKIDQSTVTVVTKRVWLGFGREDLIELLKGKANLRPTPPDDVKIYVTVPGGGSYANERLDIGNDVDLEVSWEEVQETEKES